MPAELLTKAAYDALSPWRQGYMHYMQEAQPGSMLAGTGNPYAAGTREHESWNEGQMQACLVAQDSEE
jgi:hypothetical protein